MIGFVKNASLLSLQKSRSEIKVNHFYHVAVSCFFSFLSNEFELKLAETKRKQEIEANFSTQSFSKRPIDKPEAAPDSKRQAVEAPTGSPKRPVLPRLTAFSRETFKGVEKTTRKLAHHSSLNSHSSDDTDSTPSTDSQLQSSKGRYMMKKSLSNAVLPCLGSYS